MASGPPYAWRAHETPEVLRFGEAVAVKSVTGRPRREVYGFGREDIGKLADILAFFASDALSPAFYLSPAGFTPEMGEALTGAGFRQTAFEQAILYGIPPAERVPLPPRVSLESVAEHNLTEFVETAAMAFEWPDAWREYAKRGLSEEFGAAGAHYFLARYHGKAAGVGSLALRDGIAALYDGAVIPEFRRHGIHLALVRQRLHLAHLEWAELVIGGAAYGSVSFVNQQKAGMRLAYVESVWSRV